MLQLIPNASGWFLYTVQQYTIHLLLPTSLQLSAHFSGGSCVEPDIHYLLEKGAIQEAPPSRGIQFLQTLLSGPGFVAFPTHLLNFMLRMFSFQMLTLKRNLSRTEDAYSIFRSSRDSATIISSGFFLLTWTWMLLLKLNYLNEWLILRWSEKLVIRLQDLVLDYQQRPG